jgi:hypothetical protein
MAKSKKELTLVTTPGLTNATSAGYSHVPQIVDFANEAIKSQWDKTIGTLNHVFTEPTSSNFRVKEIEVALELTAEGGFRLLLSSNLSASTAIRIKLERKE